LIVADPGNGRIQRYTLDGSFLETIHVGEPLEAPRGMAFDSSASLYVFDSNSRRVEKFTRDTSGS
jgi:hypothetical protein